jgi:hypothetical protein
VATGSAYEGPVEALELYEEVVARHAQAERKGAKMPYTSLNGHMFSFLGSDGVMALRLPGELREEFLAKYETDPIEQYGRVMAEYVAIPDGLRLPGELREAWFHRSHEWVGTLEPEPTKR